ncbi:MAG: hypothetical protein ACRDT8_12320 [Micromonosporaceae bacterium]
MRQRHGYAIENVWRHARLSLRSRLPRRAFRQPPQVDASVLVVRKRR